jgi:hypothetical protein
VTIDLLTRLIVRSPFISVRSALVVGSIVGAVGVAGYSMLAARTHVAVVEGKKKDKPHLLDEPSTSAFAPSEFRAYLDWRDWRMGVVLEWEPTSDEVRIYRIPAGRSKYVQTDGRSGRLFDADIVPGRIHWYVACVRVQGQEYCADPIAFDVPAGI